MDDIKIIGDELWLNGTKVAMLCRNYPSLDAAVRLFLTNQLTGRSVPSWPR